MTFLFLTQAGDDRARFFRFRGGLRGLSRFLLLLLFVAVVFVFNVGLASGLLPIDDQGLRILLGGLKFCFLLLLEFLAGKEFLFLSGGHLHDVLLGLILLDHHAALGVKEFNASSLIELSLTDLFTKLL